MEVVDFETAVETYDNYRILIEELEEARADLKEIEESCGDLRYYLNIFDALNYANMKNYGRYDDTINRFLKEHKQLEEFKDLKYYIGTYLKDMSFLETKSICLPLSQFILLTRNDRKYLVDLEYLDMQDVTEYNQELIEFIIKMLKTQGYFVGYAEDSDLPLLMNIKEDLECNRPVGVAEEYYEGESLAYQMSLEFESAKFDDEKTGYKKINSATRPSPFILDSNVIQDKWKELDELEPNISREEYLLRYYKLLMLFNNYVEKVYDDAPVEEKEYVLDAYQYYSSDVLKDGVDMQERIHHFRTVSPVVNTEILKRKMLNKK